MPVLLPLIHMSLTGSVFTTLAVAVERCLTVIAPFTKLKVSRYPCIADNYFNCVKVVVKENKDF